jgi:hypothetical protein
VGGRTVAGLRLHHVVLDELIILAALPGLQVGFGRIVASEIEAPNMLANLVCSG